MDAIPGVEQAMRKLFALAALPLLAAAPVTVKITQATVTWGAGVEPKGAMPPGHFEAQVLLRGRKLPGHPIFRVWRAKLGDFPGLEGKTVKCPPMAKAFRLEATATRGAGGTWVLQGVWPGAPESEDRLVVEVSAGPRSLGWAASPLREQLLPTVGKPPAVSRESDR